MKPDLSKKQMAFTEYKRKSQSIISLEERKRQRESLKVTRINRNGDDAS